MSATSVVPKLGIVRNPFRNYHHPRPGPHDQHLPPYLLPILTARPAANLLAYDFYSQGISPLSITDSKDFTINRFVTDLDALVALEAPTGMLKIVAHSAGTFIASRWLLSSSAAARIPRAVSLGGLIRTPISAEVAAMQMQLAAAIEASGPVFTVDRTLPMLLDHKTLRERPVAVALLRGDNGADGHRYAATIRAFSKGPISEGSAIAWETFPGNVKSLIVDGEEDAVASPDIISAMESNIPRARMELLKEVGHSPSIEAPAETADVIVSFLQENQVQQPE
ncbi:hypothetical protein A0H81_07579 [Grifola frondosa]|uniref:AB hydrolase-1 domain-containing protein n=1 Tax=Grifola frondosa TaxID=5627 RepID=A0A1C7M6H9_GRIFR|nr:hypothetical protein A0H81_07579 [Grifola frondosa]